MKDWSQARISTLGCWVFQCTEKTPVGMTVSDQQKAFTEILTLACFPTAEIYHLDLWDPSWEGKRCQRWPKKNQSKSSLPKSLVQKKTLHFWCCSWPPEAWVQATVWHRAERRNEHLTPGPQGTTLGATTYIRKPQKTTHHFACREHTME